MKMRKLTTIAVAVFILLTVADSITTFWAVSIGFREANPLLYPIAHTGWIFPAMILPTLLIGILLIRYTERIRLSLTAMIFCGLTVWMALLVMAIAHNSHLISVFV